MAEHDHTSKQNADAVDAEILEILQKDARATVAQIATMLGRSEEDIAGRIERMEAQGIILRYKAVINWERAGEEQVLALIEVRVAPQRDVGFDAIAARIYRFPEARTVYLVSGDYDLAVEVVGRTMKDVANFVSAKLAPLEGVQATTTHFLLKRYKEDGVVIEGQAEELRREPIVP